MARRARFCVRRSTLAQVRGAADGFRQPRAEPLAHRLSPFHDPISFAGEFRVADDGGVGISTHPLTRDLPRRPVSSSRSYPIRASDWPVGLASPAVPDDPIAEVLMPPRCRGGLALSFDPATISSSDSGHGGAHSARPRLLSGDGVCIPAVAQERLPFGRRGCAQDTVLADKMYTKQQAIR